MNAGAVIADGPTRSVLSSPVVIEAYLGEAAA
jgi:ABC-type branched-subunit amino acid transport system ATPase component